MDCFEELFSKYDFKNLEFDFVTSSANQLIKDGFERNNDKAVYSQLLSFIDITSLNFSDSQESIISFVNKINAFDDQFEILPHPASICVFPAFVPVVKDNLQENLDIAAVVGFPYPHTFTEVKIAETAMAVMEGASEIDYVMPISSFLASNYDDVYMELTEIKSACQNAKFKVILETGLLNSPELIKKASILAMSAGADFIKTSTGKYSISATYEAVYVMANAIKEFNELNSAMVGLKVAGGVSSTSDAVSYFTLVKSVLGDNWMTPEYFRIGASKLVNNLLSSVSGKDISYF
jgi:deoxyribose-phosphate aldolase